MAVFPDSQGQLTSQSEKEIIQAFDRPIRSTIFNFNKIVTDINIDSNTLDF